MFYIKTTLTTKLDRVNDSKIRDEYKLHVYTDHLLPSVRFALAVHDNTKTSLNNLDQKIQVYKWHGWYNPMLLFNIFNKGIKSIEST